MAIDPSLLRAALSSGRRREEAALAASFLTRRERELLQLLADGATTERIAATLGVSPTTARTHVQNVLNKLGVHSRLEAVAFALRHGVISRGNRPDG